MSGTSESKQKKSPAAKKTLEVKFWFKIRYSTFLTSLSTEVKNGYQQVFEKPNKLSNGIDENIHSH